MTIKVGDKLLQGVKNYLEDATNSIEAETNLDVADEIMLMPKDGTVDVRITKSVPTLNDMSLTFQVIACDSKTISCIHPFTGSESVVRKDEFRGFLMELIAGMYYEFIDNRSWEED